MDLKGFSFISPLFRRIPLLFFRANWDFFFIRFWLQNRFLRNFALHIHSLCRLLEFLFCKRLHAIGHRVKLCVCSQCRVYSVCVCVCTKTGSVPALPIEDYRINRQLKILFVCVWDAVLKGYVYWRWVVIDSIGINREASGRCCRWLGWPFERIGRRHYSRRIFIGLFIFTLWFHVTIFVSRKRIRATEIIAFVGANMQFIQPLSMVFFVVSETQLDSNVA